MRRMKRMRNIKRLCCPTSHLSMRRPNTNCRARPHTTWRHTCSQVHYTPQNCIQFSNSSFFTPTISAMQINKKKSTEHSTKTTWHFLIHHFGKQSGKNIKKRLFLDSFWYVTEICFLQKSTTKRAGFFSLEFIVVRHIIQSIKRH